MERNNYWVVLNLFKHLRYKLNIQLWQYNDLILNYTAFDSPVRYLYSFQKWKNTPNNLVQCTACDESFFVSSVSFISRVAGRTRLGWNIDFISHLFWIFYIVLFYCHAEGGVVVLYFLYRFVLLPCGGGVFVFFLPYLDVSFGFDECFRDFNLVKKNCIVEGGLFVIVCLVYVNPIIDKLFDFLGTRRGIFSDGIFPNGTRRF